MNRPRVIIVDDRPSTGANALVNELERIDVIAEVNEPGEVEEDKLLRADVVLVDYKLENWAVAVDGAAPIETSPRDGLALAAVLTSRLRAADERIRGIALYSAELAHLVRDFSREVTEHAAARVNGIDWAFQKEELADLPPNAIRVKEFATAVQSLGALWSANGEAGGENGDPHASIRRFLAVPDTGWAEVAMRDVLAAQPPIHQFAESSQGVTVLRWLAQRVLPYPTFLIDRTQIALACGVTPEGLENVDPERLGSVFDECTYVGELSGFLGPRWWRAAVRRRLREWTESSAPSAAAAERLAAELGEELELLDPITSVLAMDESLQCPAGLISRERGLRVRPDDWPIFAEPAWVEEDLVKATPALLSYVEPGDLARLGEQT